MKKLIGSLILLGAGLLSTTAHARYVQVAADSSGAKLDNVTSNGGYFKFTAKNGYVPVQAHDAGANRSFSCSIWYTNSSFNVFRETLLSSSNFYNWTWNNLSGSYRVSLYVYRDAAGTCSDAVYNWEAHGPTPQTWGQQ